MTDITLIYTTWPDIVEASKAGKALVEQRQVACVNILPQMTSIYRWNDTIEEAQEVVMLLKTTRELSKDVIEAINAMHPYAVPAVLVLPIEGGGEKFLEWVKEETLTNYGKSV